MNDFIHFPRNEKTTFFFHWQFIQRPSNKQQQRRNSIGGSGRGDCSEKQRKKKHQKKRAAVQTRSDKFATLSAGRSQTSHFLWRAGVLGDRCVDMRRGGV